MESLLMTSEVKSVEKLILKKLVKKVIRNPVTRVHFCENVCETVCSGYTTVSYNMPVCRVCHEVCPTTTPFSFSSKLSWF
jgi:MinD superfamily P-loop ATPase